MALLFVTLLPACTPAIAGSPACPAARTDESARVDYVFDGDTVRLTDGRRVRLIGINTPELDHDGTRHEAFAVTARTALQELLKSADSNLRLQYGSERQDRYGRLLAHAFLPDGRNIAPLMLEQGLATALVVPPNTWGMDCYRELERRARADRRGLWSLPKYQALDSRNLEQDLRGFRIIRGTVNAVRPAGSGTRVELEGPLTLYIGKRDRGNFSAEFFDALAGSTVEVRGWLKPRKDGLTMNIRHPAALTVLETASS